MIPLPSSPLTLPRRASTPFSPPANTLRPRQASPLPPQPDHPLQLPDPLPVPTASCVARPYSAWRPPTSLPRFSSLGHAETMLVSEIHPCRFPFVAVFLSPMFARPAPSPRGGMAHRLHVALRDFWSLMATPRPPHRGWIRSPGLTAFIAVIAD